MDLAKISVCIIAKNAQACIKDCLESVREFGEVVMVDNQSTDATCQIAQSFENVRVFSSPFIGFGGLKNLAISHASFDWILNLDADEVLDFDALEFIKQADLQDANIYAFRRKNHYGGTWIKACGWYPDYVLRLFHKKFTQFNDNIVHESLNTKGLSVKKLNVHLKHFPIERMDEMVEKMNRYTTLSSENLHKKSSLLAAILRLFWVFFKDYFLRGGFKYGYKGFVIAYINANGAFFKYAKKYEKQKR